MMMMMMVNIVGIINIIFFEWGDGYKKRKAQKASINKRRVNAYCLAAIKIVGLVHSEDEKKETEKTFLTT